MFDDIYSTILVKSDEFLRAILRGKQYGNLHIIVVHDTFLMAVLRPSQNRLVFVSLMVTETPIVVRIRPYSNLPLHLIKHEKSIFVISFNLSKSELLLLVADLVKMHSSLKRPYDFGA